MPIPEQHDNGMLVADVGNETRFVIICEATQCANCKWDEEEAAAHETSRNMLLRCEGNGGDNIMLEEEDFSVSDKSEVDQKDSQRKKQCGCGCGCGWGRGGG